MKTRITFITLLTCVVTSLLLTWSVWNRSRSHLDNMDYSPLLSVPLLMEGRILPFDSFARRFSTLLTGSENPNLKEFSKSVAKQRGQNPPKSFRMNAAEFVMLLISRDDPLKDPVISLKHPDLKARLDIKPEATHIAFQDVVNHPELEKLQQSYHQKQQAKIPLTTLDEAFLDLSKQLNLISELIQGQSFTFFPANGDRYTNWIPVTQLEHSKDPQALEVFKAFQGILHGNYYGNHKGDSNHSHGDQHQGPESTLHAGINTIKKLQSERFTSDPSIWGRISLELLYNRLKPFQITWIIYLFGLLCGVLSLLLGIKFLGGLSSLYLVAGFLTHSYGLYLRMSILERPPVGNMYESVVFVGWCVVLCFLLIHFKHRDEILRNIALGASMLIMIMADLLPMSSDLGMLEAVLRSNYWLTIHVLTIVASYGAFALACGLGHYYIYLIFRGSPTSDPGLKILSDTIYQALKIGIILIGAGTILGGVWANESWGRFWGWDPKETWALISFLGYLAILHGRKAGWYQDLGLAVGSIIGFLLILMTWYGVNFVLGTGLHSYGFGSGGTHYALSFTLFELALLGLVFLKRKQSIKTLS
jgi:cytochrome c-type biogenesis protein CcsB